MTTSERRGSPQVRGKTKSEIGSAVRAARLKKGWTLRTLGAKVGVQFTTLSKIENGHELPGLGLLLRIETMTGVRGLRAMRVCPTCGSKVGEKP